MISYAELEQFYEGLVIKLREQGVVCAITSGMAALLESGLVPENALTWLPDVMIYFEWLNE